MPQPSNARSTLVVLACLSATGTVRCTLDEIGEESDAALNDVLDELPGPGDGEAGVGDAIDETHQDGGGDSFSPLSVPGVELWYRSDQGLVTNAGAVTKWQDFSGKNDPARDLSPGTLAAPTVVDGGKNFSGVFFATNAGLRTSPIGPIAVPLSLFAVVGKLVTGPPTSPTYVIDSIEPPAQLAVVAGKSLVIGQDNVLQEYAGQPGPAAPGVVGAPVSVIAIFDGATSRLFQSSNGADASTSSPGPTASATGFTVGNYSGATATSADYGFAGYIAEFAVYSHALLPTEVQQLNEYAATRYGIAITP